MPFFSMDESTEAQEPKAFSGYLIPPNFHLLMISKSYENF
jgi:hypothetical protein